MDIIKLRTTMQEQCQLEGKDPVLVGVSGGPDSLSLLDILCRLEYSVIVAHFNHGLRPEAAQDAETVRKYAEKLGLVFVAGSDDVAAFAKSARLSIEEAARKARYRFLFEQARQTGAQAVGVAHNADDQVETVLMHMLRGSGLNGLKGMAYRGLLPEWDVEIPLIRPLLGVWRAEILTYCQERGLKPLIDPTNQDTIHFRNRLRHELIPNLETYNPQVRQVIWRMACTLAADNEALEHETSLRWADCITRKEDDFISLSLPALRNLGLSLQRRVLRKAIGHLRPDMEDIDFSAIERTLEFIKRPTLTRQVDLVDNMRLYLEDEQIFIAEWNSALLDESWPQLIPGSSFILQMSGRIRPCPGWQLEAKIFDEPPAGVRIQHNTDLYQAWLDAETLENPLAIRTRRPGDRYQPLGMNGHSQKLSDFMVNTHLAVRARANWPLVCSGSQIAWIPGYPPSHAFKVTESTTKFALIKMTRE
jgi:tRNA(Ile)-lysidine synthase